MKCQSFCTALLDDFHIALTIWSLYFSKADFISFTSNFEILPALTMRISVYWDEAVKNGISLQIFRRCCTSIFRVEGPHTMKVEATYPTEKSVKSTRLQGVTPNFIRPVRNFVQFRFNALTSANN